MKSNDIFVIPRSKVLNQLEYWITTKSEFYITFHRFQNSLSFSGNINFQICLTTSQINIDLPNSTTFSFILTSKDKIFFGQESKNVILASDFDRLILIENLRLSKKIINQIHQISEINDSQTILELFKEVYPKSKVTIVSRKRFYYLHEVCYLPARTVNIEKYIESIINKMTDFSEDDVWKTRTILYELFDNAIEHGSKFDENKIIRSEVMINNNGLYIVISDQGEGFDLSNINIDFNQENPTGRGIMMVKILSDMFWVKDRGKTIKVFLNRSNSQNIPFISYQHTF